MPNPLRTTNLSFPEKGTQARPRRGSHSLKCLRTRAGSTPPGLFGVTSPFSRLHIVGSTRPPEKALGEHCEGSYRAGSKLLMFLLAARIGLKYCHRRPRFKVKSRDTL